MAIAGDTHNIPSRKIELRNGRVYSSSMVTNKPREIVERDIDRAAQRLLNGEWFEMYCSGPQFLEVQQRVNEILAERKSTNGNLE